MPSLLALQGRAEHLSKAKCHEFLPCGSVVSPSRKPGHHQEKDMRLMPGGQEHQSPSPSFPGWLRGQLGTSAALPKTSQLQPGLSQWSDLPGTQAPPTWRDIKPIQKGCPGGNNNNQLTHPLTTESQILMMKNREEEVEEWGE